MCSAQLKKGKSDGNVVLFAGFVTGSLGILVTHPMDVIRTRMKNRQPPLSYAQTTIDLVKHRGVLRGLFAGWIPPTLFRGGSFAINRLAYRYTERYTDSELLKGIVSGVAKAVGDTPVLLAKVVNQVSNEPFRESIPNYFRFFRVTFQSRGLFGLFKGYWGTALDHGVFFPAYYYTRSYFQEIEVHPIASGILAAWIGILPAYPIGVIRVRFQTKQCTTYLEETTLWLKANGFRIYKYYPSLSLTFMRSLTRFGFGMYLCERMENALGKMFHTD